MTTSDERSPARRRYATDLSDAQWAAIRPLIQPPRSMNPRNRSQRDIVDAIRYILQANCPWRQVPLDLPPWQTVYAHFHRWERRGLWQRIRDMLAEEAGARVGRCRESSDLEGIRFS